MRSCSRTSSRILKHIEGIYPYVTSFHVNRDLQLTDSCKDVLRAYDVVRVPRAGDVANASKRAGDVYQGHGPSGPDDDGRRKDLDLQWEMVWSHDCRKDVSRAIQILEESGVYRRE